MSSYNRRGEARCISRILDVQPRIDRMMHNPLGSTTKLEEASKISKLG